MWIKICGIRDLANAERVWGARPDAIGLNFHPGSVRFVEPARAAEIVSRTPPEIEAVGVFVDRTAEEIVAISRTVGLRTVQLHGREPVDLPQRIRALDPTLSVVRATWFGPDGLAGLDAHLAACASAGLELRACLVDAYVPGAYGGTGATVAWNDLGPAYASRPRPALILAGGLKPGNVAEAIRVVRPWGVDVAGGVERAAGEKDADLVAAFVQAARAAGEAVGPSA
jgi:phosphoribosylanthranilate isomerase